MLSLALWIIESRQLQRRLLENGIPEIEAETTGSYAIWRLLAPARDRREPGEPRTKKVAVHNISAISQTLDIILFQVYDIIVTLMER